MFWACIRIAEWLRSSFSNQEVSGSIPDAGTNFNVEVLHLLYSVYGDIKVNKAKFMIYICAIRMISTVVKTCELCMYVYGLGKMHLSYWEAEEHPAAEHTMKMS